MIDNWSVKLMITVIFLNIISWGTSTEKEMLSYLRSNSSILPYPDPDSTPEAQVYRTYLNHVESPYTHVTESYYLTTTDNLYEKGCELGTHVWSLSGAQESFVFLDFGYPMDFGQSVYGTILFGGDPVTTTEIGDASFSFAEGYYDCLGDDRESYLRVGIGTSNEGSDVSWSHGEKWAILVDSVNDRLLEQGYRGEVTAVGASDIEPDWNSVTKSADWIEGYFNAYGYNEFYNVGAASGCPINLPPTEPESGSYNPENCNNAWTQESIYNVTWQNIGSRPIPQIYDNYENNAQQWYRLALYSYLTHGGVIAHYGTVAQYGSCQQHKELCDDWGGNWCDIADVCFINNLDNTPEAGFLQLKRWINSDPYNRVKSNMRWATDMEYYPSPLVYAAED